LTYAQNFFSKYRTIYTPSQRPYGNIILSTEALWEYHFAFLRRFNLRRNRFDIIKLQFTKQLYEFITLQYYLSYYTIKPTKFGAKLSLFSVIT